MMRECSACHQMKDATAFSPHPKGTRRICKPCNVISVREWRRQNPAKAKAGARLHRAQNPEKYREYAENRTLRDPMGERRRQLKKLYGLTIEQHDAMLAAQDRRCAICRDEFVSTPFVDHDHTSGVVRGLLCKPCNSAIGLAKESDEILRAMIAYLAHHRIRRSA